MRPECREVRDVMMLDVSESEKMRLAVSFDRLKQKL